MPAPIPQARVCERPPGEFGVRAAGVHETLREQSSGAVRRVDTSSSASHLARCEGIMLGPVRALARRTERSPFTLSREAVAIVCRQHFQIPARQRARVSFRRRVSAELDDRVLCETVMS